MSNPFDAAIRALEGISSNLPEGCTAVKQDRAAIRLLEAAGKVDKPMALAAVDAILRMLKNDGLESIAQSLREIRPLLEALPDEVKP